MSCIPLTFCTPGSIAISRMPFIASAWTALVPSGFANRVLALAQAATRVRSVEVIYTEIRPMLDGPALAYYRDRRSACPYATLVAYAADGQQLEDVSLLRGCVDLCWKIDSEKKGV